VSPSSPLHDCSIRELVDGEAGVPAETLVPMMTDSDSGEALHPQRGSSPGRVEAALAGAHGTHVEGVWSELPVDDRAAAIRRLQGELASRLNELAAADSLDSGVPQTITGALIGAVIGRLELAATLIEKGFGHEEQISSVGACDQWQIPWGPAAIFLPWNAATPTAINKTADALVAGCPIIIKPSEWASHFSGPFADAVRAALPSGVVQIVHGDRSVGEALVGDARVAAVSYTGGVAGGTAVAEACGRQLKPVDLELSGNNPVVALPDAEPETVVAHVVTGMLLLNGQWCAGPRRLIVPELDADRYLTALAAMLAAVPIGVTSDPGTQLGPLAHEGHQRHIESQLAEFEALGCEVRRYGNLPSSKGHFAAPAVVLADKGASLQTEVFGPVLLVRTYSDVDEAITIANDHPYGLTGYVFGNDRSRARAVGHRLRAGRVTINAVLGGPPDLSPIFSMWGASGLGSIGDGQGPNFFSGFRFVG